MKIGLFFGSFNPVHIGHLIIANYMAQHTDLEQIWLVVSPHNPLKNKATLARDRDRLNMIELAVADNPRLRASGIELKLPQPSYTVDTLAYLHEAYPQHTFALIMGGDNLASLTKWKNYEVLLAQHLIYVYARPEYALGDLAAHPNVRILSDVPQMQISATFIRESLHNSKSIRYLVADAVLQYIEESRLYRSK
jgi:nicotinate-nucleotide adenylyltransferase